MTSITTQVPDEMVAALDSAAVILKSSRSDVILQALEQYLEDLEDLEMAAQRLNDPSDPFLDWEEVGRDLLGSD